MEVIGRKIVDVRSLSKKVIEKEGWEYSPYNSICLVLDDGSIIYPSQDEEGNGPGSFFAMDKELETAYYIFPNEVTA
jgi:hypothetical protein